VGEMKRLLKELRAVLLLTLGSAKQIKKLKWPHQIACDQHKANPAQENR
jgi:hypothetical protein